MFHQRASSIFSMTLQHLVFKYYNPESFRIPFIIIFVLTAGNLDPTPYSCFVFIVARLMLLLFYWGMLGKMPTTGLHEKE